MKTYRTIVKDTEVDWIKEYEVRALNLETMLFETCSDFCADDNVRIEVYHPLEVCDVIIGFNENEVSKTLNYKKFNGFNVIYALYNKTSNELVGFVFEDK